MCDKAVKKSNCDKICSSCFIAQWMYENRIAGEPGFWSLVSDQFKSWEVLEYAINKFHLCIWFCS